MGSSDQAPRPTGVLGSQQLPEGVSCWVRWSALCVLSCENSFHSGKGTTGKIQFRGQDVLGRVSFVGQAKEDWWTCSQNLGSTLILWIIASHFWVCRPTAIAGRRKWDSQLEESHKKDICSPKTCLPRGDVEESSIIEWLTRGNHSILHHKCGNNYIPKGGAINIKSFLMQNH